MSEATPRPWRMAEHSDPYHIESVDDGMYIAHTHVGGRGLEEAAANAALIVRAVNAHDDLVAACEAAEQEILSLFHAQHALKDADANPAVKQLRAALAKARGET